ncbi:MAG: hypothetical protein ACRD15_06385 [Vicinamibacterales bacterium]
MSRNVPVIVFAALGSLGGVTRPSAESPAQQNCLHGPDSTPEQQARRREALGATRNVNTMQANQPAARGNRYLRHEDLAASPFATKQASPAFKKLNLTPGEEILPGWQLTLDVSEDSYWFMIKDKTDPCGFAFISNKAGIIYTAEPIR